MSVTLLLPAAHRHLADGKESLELSAATVAAALDGLVARFPRLKEHLFTADGRLRNFVNLYLGDEDVRQLGQLATPLKDGDVLAIVPAVAGGDSRTQPHAPPRAAEPAVLSREEIERYSRHLIMPEVGFQGQQKLKRANVLLIGAGGLGSPAALYLAAAGVGRLGLVDFDRVDVSNLQRQIIHATRDVGRSKLASARESIQALNPHVEVDIYETTLTSENAFSILEPYDVILDGTDNFPTRYLVNDACVLTGKPNVYGSIFRFEGQASVFDARRGPCYRCLYPEPPPPGLVPSCAEGGVLGILPGLVGVIQATEAIKLVLGAGRPLIGRLLLFDALGMSFREMKLRKDPACPVWGEHRTIDHLIDYEEFCGLPAAAAAETLAPDDEISARDLRARLDRGDDFLLLDVREPHEHALARIPGAHLIPLGELPSRLGELAGATDIVVHCRSGARSARAAKLLKQAGFPRVRNLAGGILAWSRDVDPSVPRY